jgi:hypothetical protein
MGRINHLFYDTGKYVSSWSGENFTWGAIGQGLARSDMTWSFRNQWRIFDGMIPVTGEEAYCIAEPQELQIRQSGCELDFRGYINDPGLGCVSNRYCYEPSENVQEEINEIELAACSDQILERCKELKIKVQKWP